MNPYAQTLATSVKHDQLQHASVRHVLKTKSSRATYPAPEPDLIQQLSKGNVPGNTGCPNTKVTSSLQER